MWVAIIRKHLPPGREIRSVTPLGGRKAVLDACRNDQGQGPPRIYIIDGDFDHVLQRRPPPLKHLHRLGVYSQENLYIRRDSIEGIAAVFRPDEDPTEVGERFEEYLSGVWSPVLRRLFALYACNEKLGGGNVTSSFHIERLREPGRVPPQPSPNKLREQALNVFRDLKRRHGTRAVLNCLSTTRPVAKSLPDASVISGKTYLLPVTRHWIQSEMGVSLPEAQTSLLLIGQCRGALDERLKRKIERALS